MRAYIQKKASKREIFLGLLLMSLLISFINLSFGQEKDEDDIPKEQQPVEERGQEDSFIENVGELPGDIVTLPFTLFFKGISHAARVIDYNAIVLRVTDWLTSADGKRRVRPIFSPMSGGGLIFIQDDLLKKGMRFRASGSFGNRTRRDFYGKLQDKQFFSSRLGLEASGFYMRLPDEDFFEIGNDSREETETNYLHEESNFEFDLLSVPFSRALFSAGVAYSNVNIKEGRDPNNPSIDSLFTPDQVPGFFGAEMWSFLIKFYRDTRNATGHPTEGGEEFVSLEFSDEIDGSEFSYRKVTLDLRRYFNLFFKRVLALRVRTEITDSPDDKQIPFYRLAGLGGRDNLRGYRPVRFRDRDLVLASAEYRWLIHGQAIAYGFFEEGRVFSDVFDDFTLDHFKYSFGGGIRLRGRDGGLIAIFEIAKSKEQIRFNFGLNTELRRF